MSELDDFLTPTLVRQLDAEKALINGDPEPRLAMWSTQDPVTVLGAMKDDIGAEEARQVFRWLATRFSNLTDYRFELVAAGASGDLAYTVGYEHMSFPWTANRSTRGRCGSPTSTAARTASGRPSTATPTPHRSTRPLPRPPRRSWLGRCGQAASCRLADPDDLSWAPVRRAGRLGRPISTTSSPRACRKLASPARSCRHPRPPSSAAPAPAPGRAPAGVGSRQGQQPPLSAPGSRPPDRSLRQRGCRPAWSS
jgi:hypothetical protein